MRRLRPLLVPVVAVLVVAAAVVVRILYLGSQSYWNDEVFSVNQARQDLPAVFDVGTTEVHTPLYAVLLHYWVTWGNSTITLWTHGLSALAGLASIAVTWTGLRHSGLTPRARWVAVALTAASGFGIVYSQETRPYALALLGATGLTTATAHVTVALVERRRPRWHWWLLWGLLAATAHLLGALLVGVAAVVLAGVAIACRRPWQAPVAFGCAALAVAPQAAWLLHGMTRPGFADGTRWIGAPDLEDIGNLFTSVVAAGGLTTTSGGYVWTARLGMLGATGLVAGGLMLLLVPAAGSRLGALLPRRGGPSPSVGALGNGEGAAAPPAAAPPTDAPPADAPPAAAPSTATAAAAAGRLDAGRDGPLALLLLIVAVLTIAVTYVVAQTVHIWTLRNMIVVVPALSWGVAWLVVALPRRGWAKESAAVAVLVAAGVALVPISADLDRPYKTDLRSAILYLARMRAEHPDAAFSFFGPGPVNSLVAADRGPDDPQLQRIFDDIDPHPRAESAINRLHRLRGPQAVFYYTGVSGAGDDDAAARILTQLDDPGCVRVPLHGVVLIACDDAPPPDTQAG